MAFQIGTTVYPKRSKIKLGIVKVVSSDSMSSVAEVVYRACNSILEAKLL